ncbi:hypothetical protein WJX84_006278 [Apatococcus fuscideae]|uniref:Formyl transferase N-terminal domain-containing protein n=1 Tax=Apatococcus fuscideae TaxID=2026836 RepID=A0AAW1SW78_9CHLO
MFRSARLGLRTSSRNCVESLSLARLGHSTDSAAEELQTSTLLVKCPDAKGIAAALYQVMYDNHCNIVRSDHFTDTAGWTFFQRLCFKLPSTDVASIDSAINKLAQTWRMDYTLQHEKARTKVAVLVSKMDHCLWDLLIRHRQGELKCDLNVIVSNHPDLEHVAQAFNIDFVCIAQPTAPKEKRKQQMESMLEDILHEKGTELIIMARYMQILSDKFCSRHAEHTINIHHSFLPAFVGAKPYHKAFERGVKVIGATAHYATTDLDAGPIIEQGVTRITHRDSVEDMIREGRDLERVVLARAVRWHLENRVMVYGNKTVVFN